MYEGRGSLTFNDDPGNLPARALIDELRTRSLRLAVERTQLNMREWPPNLPTCVGKSSHLASWGIPRF